MKLKNLAGDHRDRVLSHIEARTRHYLANDHSGHDVWHALRVRRLALKIQGDEGGDQLVVEISALVHDLYDHKLQASLNGVPRPLNGWLVEVGVSPAQALAIQTIVEAMGYPGAAGIDEDLSIEGQCVRDADRLDAMGAIGIARAFAYGGIAGRPLYGPHSNARTHSSRNDYLASSGTTIDHFYEKLLHLRDRMTTPTGRKLALARHERLLAFLHDFEDEWNGSS